MDRVTEVLVEALRQALAGPGEQRLYRAGKLEGLFPGRTGAAGAAAEQALAGGLLEVVRTEVKGKTSIAWVRPTPRGVDFLHQRESPVRALEELRHTLRLNQQAVPVWLEEVRAGLHALDDRLAADAAKWLQRLEALSRRVDETLRRLEDAIPLLPPDLAEAHPWAIDALNYLDRRGEITGGPAGTAGPTPDGSSVGHAVPAGPPCPLPELFAALTGQHPALSITSFHEGLRRLHERRVLRLTPAENLAAVPQPEYALLDGPAVLYYATR